MRWQNVAAIAAKDLRVLIAKRGIRLALVLFPVIVAVGLSLVVRYGGGHGGLPAAVLPRVLNSFVFFFSIGAAILPAAIASYSLVGEKVERSLEPLLATPVTDGEILLGKGIAALVPPVVAMWAGGALFMALSDQATRRKLGHLYFPDTEAVLIITVIVPLAAVTCVALSVLVSARVTDVRAAQQLTTLFMLPFMALYVLAEIGVFTLDAASVGVIAGVLAAADSGLLAAARLTFRREEILTRWT